MQPRRLRTIPGAVRLEVDRGERCTCGPAQDAILDGPGYQPRLTPSNPDSLPTYGITLPRALIGLVVTF